MDAEQLYQRLRIQLIGDLHIGRKRAGERLTSIRELARSTGLDHRIVARAYARLEQEGLVEVRGRAGVFLRERRATSRSDSEESLLAQLAHDLAMQRVPLPDLVRHVREAVRADLACICMESTEDHEVAIATEMEHSFGISPRCIRVRGSRSPDQDAALMRALARADFIVTTAFHAAEMRALADSAGKPLVTLVVNAELATTLAKLLESRAVTIVAADGAFAARAEVYFRESRYAGRFRVLRYDDPAVMRLDPDDPAVLFTRAARRRLALAEYHYRPDMPPFFSAESIAAVAQLIVRLNLRRMNQQPHAAHSDEPALRAAGETACSLE